MAVGKRMALWWWLCAAALAADAAADERGGELFRPCAACHGPAAHGNREVRAPSLAGLDEWYVVRQLQNFRNGRRGGADADPYAAQMARMAQQLWDDGEVKSVAGYVASLPPAPAEATVRGKAKRGEAAFASCGACHGADAAGNPDLGAPALATLDDWYLVEQLEAFRTGRRGSHPDDAPGQVMRSAAAALGDDAVALDVAAYLGTLRDRASENARH